LLVTDDALPAIGTALRLRIGIDATPVGIKGGERGGVHQYIYQLARHLCRIAPQAEFRLLFALPHRRHVDTIRGFMASLEATNVHFRRSPLPVNWLQRLRVPADALLGGLDVFHSPAHVSLRCRSCPMVVTVHDLAFLRDLADPAMMARLEPMERREWALRQRFFAELAENITYSVNEARFVIAVSASTARDLQELLGVAADRVRVVHHGLRRDVVRIDSAEILAAGRSRYRLGADDYWLYVGILDPNKNLPRMIEGYAEYRRLGGNSLLALAGRARCFASLLRGQLLQLGVWQHVRFLDYVPDGDLAMLYSGARGLIMPSPLEGFGLPALEAMACGTPVIAANAGALPEVTGGAAWLVEPFNPAGFAAAMLTLENDQEVREGLIAAGYRRAAGFTWARAAAETLAVYRDAVAEAA
jgi:glycosyltransferase involved in cell wall biosynthesis